MTTDSEPIGCCCGQYHILKDKFLGSGAFGSVYKATDKAGKEICAKQVKILLSEDTDAEHVSKSQQLLENEIKALKLGEKNDHIVKYYDSQCIDHDMWLFMEYCQKGDLEAYLKKEGKQLQYPQVLKIMRQSSDAVEFLHSHKPTPIYHRDIKLSNFLVTADDTIKLADFGLVKLVPPGQKLKDYYMKTMAGTVCYMAPEFFGPTVNTVKYDGSVDIFSLGLMYAVILSYDGNDCSLIPCSLEQQLKRMTIPTFYGQEVANEENCLKAIPVFKTGVGEAKMTEDKNRKHLESVIMGMLRPRPEDRLTAEDLSKYLVGKTNQFNYSYTARDILLQGKTASKSEKKENLQKSKGHMEKAGVTVSKSEDKDEEFAIEFLKLKESGIQEDVTKFLEKHKNSFTDSKRTLKRLENITEEENAWKEAEVKIAVTGEAGVGKSSLINSLRNVSYGEPYFADVDTKGDTTTEPTPYCYPKNKNITLWDLPGINVAEGRKAANYKEEMSLDKYDIFIIATRNRFTENSYNIATYCKQKLKKPVIFVRTHAKNAVDSMMRVKRQSAETTLASIREEMEKFMDEDDHLFIIDNFEVDMFDFNSLKSHITRNLSAKQKEAFLRAQACVTKEDIEKKKSLLFEELNSASIKLQIAGGVFAGLQGLGGLAVAGLAESVSLMIGSLVIGPGLALTGLLTYVGYRMLSKEKDEAKALHTALKDTLFYYLKEFELMPESLPTWANKWYVNIEQVHKLYNELQLNDLSLCNSEELVELTLPSLGATITLNKSRALYTILDFVSQAAFMLLEKMENAATD